MSRILHTADLHLKCSGPEHEYSLAVLNEIIALAKERQVTHLLICGDLFDSFADFSNNALHLEICAAFNKLAPYCQIIYISGNHELLGKGENESLSAYHFPHMQFIAEDLKFFSDSNLEFIAVPFRKDYTSLMSASFAQKKAFRILIMRGTDSTVYSGYDTEDANGSGSAQIPDIFIRRTEADYAALGHIHEPRELLSGNAIIAYPGTPRVWRRGEFGPRTVIYFEVKSSAASKLERIPIKSAGQYREVIVPIGLEGFKADTENKLLNMAANPNDWIELVFSGVLEDSNLFEAEKMRLHSAISKKIRKCTLDTTALRTMSALSNNPAARVFLEAMDTYRPTEEGEALQVWLQARLLGLEEINECLK